MHIILGSIADTIPLTNPVSNFYKYNVSGLEWTNTMVNWSCVINIKDYNNDYNSAASAVYNTCGKDVGGVIYYPAGTYKITSDNIILKENIVIRGESTSTETAKNGKNPGNLDPKTIFECPNLKHMGLFNNDNSSNIGIVNIYLKQCAIMLWPNLKSPSKLSFWDYWVNAESVIGMGSNKLVFGNKISDVSLGNPQPGGTWYNNVVISSKPWPWAFGIGIAGYVDNNLLIGNNLIAKASNTMKTDIFNYSNVPYLFDNRYGIDAGKLLLGGVLSYNGIQNAGICNCSYKAAPYMFPRNVVIRDNYVHQNGRVGISWSGGDGINDGSSSTQIGYGTEVYNNHVQVEPNTTCYSVTGTKPTTGSDTNENRGYDQGGYGSNVTYNTGHIYRQNVAPQNGPYQTGLFISYLLVHL